MEVRRIGLGNRVLSALLALILVIGLIPASAIPAFAAEPEQVTTTKTNVGYVNTYATNLFNGNFSKAASYSDKYTWSTEGAKGHHWTYFDGLMVDAFLMYGVGTVDKNALNFAATHFNAQIKENGEIIRFGDTQNLGREVDSVTAGRALFDLLGTTVEDDRYEKALNKMYAALSNTSYFKRYNDTMNGNIQHKSTWTDWVFGLDGVYMALPFLVEYANVLKTDKLDNSAITDEAAEAEKIYTDVYNRLVWVAENMKDAKTDGNYTYYLYSHGVKDDGTSKNGHYWSRGIGWYAAALVDIIELMEKGGQAAYATDLKDRLDELFDGMLYLQDESGLWYNVPNRGEDLDNNILETSGSALMAYALMKAYNNGWVTETTIVKNGESKTVNYGKAGLNAFNGLVANGNVSATEIKDIYLKSGVGTTDAYYCGEGYKSIEAKGVGPVIMAASQANETAAQLEGQTIPSEEFKVGVISAPDMTIVKGGVIDPSGIKATLVGNQGSIKNVAGSALTYKVEYPATRAAGDITATVTASYNGVAIDTFEVTAVDPNAPATGSGKLPITTETTENPTAPPVTGNSWISVGGSGSGSGDTITYKKATSVTSGTSYVIFDIYSDKYYILKNPNTSSSDTSPNSLNVTTYDSATDTFTLTKEEAALSEWMFTLNTTYGDYTAYRVTNNNRILSVESTLLRDSGETKLIYLKKDSTGQFRLAKSADDTTNAIELPSTTWSRNSSGLVYLYEPDSGEAKYAKLAGTATYAYPVGTATGIETQILADYKVQTSKNSDGSDATDVAWTDATVKYTWDKTLDVNTAGTYTLTVTVDGKTIGEIPVLIYSNTVTVEHDVVLSVTPGAIVATEGDAFPQLTLMLTVDGVELTIPFNVSVASSDEAVVKAWQNGSNVTGNTLGKAGNANLTIGLTGFTYDGVFYNADNFAKISDIKATVPVTVNAKVEETEPTTAPPTEPSEPVYALTISGGNTVEAGNTLTLTAALTADGVAVEDYSITWSVENGTGSATIGTDGVLTAISEGTVKVTATATVGGKEVATATLDVTINAASTTDPTGNVSTTTTSGGVGKTYVFSTEGETDTNTDGFFIVGDSHKDTSYTVDAITYTEPLKMTSSANVQFTPTKAGKLTVIVTASNDGGGLLVKHGDTEDVRWGTTTNNPESHTIDLEVGVTYTIERYTKEQELLYVSYAENGSGGGGEQTTTWYNAELAQPANVTMTMGGNPFQVTKPTVSAKFVEGGATAAVDGVVLSWTVKIGSDVVSVDQDGKITALKAGTATIEVKVTALKVEGKEGTIHNDTLLTKTFTVTVNPAEETHDYKLTISGETTTVKVDETLTLTELLKDGETTGSDGYTMKWTVTDGTGSATIGETTGVLTGVTAGTVTVKATATINGKTVNSNELTITVEAAEVDPPVGGDVSYILDTDGIDDGERYLIVALVNGEYYAMVSPKTEITSLTPGDSVKVNVVDGVITLAEDGRDLREWIFTANDTEDYTQKFAGYSIKNGDNNVYINMGSNGSALKNSALSAVKAVSVQDGKYQIAKSNSSPSPLICTGDGTETWKRASSTGDQNVLLFKYNSNVTSVTLSGDDSRTIGSTEGHKTTLTPGVLFEGKPVAEGGYTLSWQSSDNTIATVDELGVVTLTGTKTGSVTITATLTDVTGETLPTEPVVASHTINVLAPGFALGDDKTIFVGGKGDRTDGAQALVDGTATAEYEIQWTVTDPNGTLTWAENEYTGSVAGTATITGKLIEVNGVDVSALNLTDSFTVTVKEDAVVSRTLNSYTMTVKKTDANDLTEVNKNLLSIVLTVTYESGKVETYTAEQLVFDTTGIDTTATGRQYIEVSCEDAGFKDTIEVNVLDGSAADGEGIINVTDNVTYTLDTNGLADNNNQQFVLVVIPDDSNPNAGIAVKNPTPTGTSSKAPANQEVIINGNILTISGSGADSEWLFDTMTETSGVYTFHISNGNLWLNGDGSSNILRPDGCDVTLVPVDEAKGLYNLVIRISSNDKYYLYYDGTKWTRSDENPTSFPNENYGVYLYQKSGDVTPVGVDFDVEKNELDLATGSNYTMPYTISVGDLLPESYDIVWKVTSGGEYVSVDDTGKITGLKAGTATVTATLITANGAQVIDNTTNEPGIVETITVTVQDEQATYSLDPAVIHVRLNGKVDFSGVKMHIDYDISDPQDIPYENLVFDVANSDLDTSTPGTYYVDVYYNGVKQTGADKVTVIVHDDPFYGLDDAITYPEYPAPGAVRINKTARGIDFLNTGIAQVELNVAGISSKQQVDVLLIIDVSNSMAWTDSWFLTNKDAGTDNLKIPEVDSNGVPQAATKLDNAMASAQDFADILLAGGNNSLSMVTFAGYDKEHDNGDDAFDSVQTPFLAVKDAQLAKDALALTKFTKLDVNDTSVKCSLQLGLVKDGKATPTTDTKTNRGNTNYDFGFGQAIDAVNALKANYEAETGVSYDESGRQIQVVIMTDGAPSHYNGNRNNGTADLRWNTDDGTYGDYGKYSEEQWLDYISKSNTLATELYSLVDGFHAIGFDLNHGGFSNKSWTQDQLKHVLEGLVENAKVSVTLASDSNALTNFCTSLAQSLVCSGTDAQVVDLVSSHFILETGTINADTPNEIKVFTRRLVTEADKGSELEVIRANGTVQTVTVGDEHIGLRVNNSEEELETITFGGENIAYSDLMEGDIWDEATGTITGKYVKYEFVGKKFSWNIGNITDKEIALTYYAYLDGSMDGDGNELAAGIYPTNESAKLQYVDANEKKATMEFPVPKIAWGSGTVNVKFFLVDKDGNYVNMAGETFENFASANFLTNTYTYQTNLNTETANPEKFTQTASDAFAQAGINSKQYSLYDDGISFWVINSTTAEGGSADSETTSSDKKKLTVVTDDSGDGSYIQTTIMIPVMSLGRLSTETPLKEEVAVLDFGKPIDIDVFNGNEKLIQNYGYKMEVYGFAKYDPNWDNLGLYLLPGERPDHLMTEDEKFSDGVNNGYFVNPEATDTVRFVPTGILDGTESVFVVVHIWKIDTDGNKVPKSDYYLYNPVHIVPATSVYYETDFAESVFTLVQKVVGQPQWGNLGSAASGNQDEDPDVNSTSKYTVGENSNAENPHTSDLYGYDSSYTGSGEYSGGSAFRVTGTGTANSYAQFTFTGTGFDIISRTDPDQGMIRVRVKDANGNIEKTVMVINKGILSLNQIPVVSVEGLPMGVHTVEIGVYVPQESGALVNKGQFVFDAVRIYGSGDGNALAEDEYKRDGEFDPALQEVRDLLISKETFEQLIDNLGYVFGSVFLDGSDSKDPGNTSLVSDYKTVGPNNEVYLQKNQAISFMVSASDLATLDIGAKSITGAGAILSVGIYTSAGKLLSSRNVNIATCTAMFYDLMYNDVTQNAVAIPGGDLIVVVANTGEGYLSITDIKTASGDGTVVQAQFMVTPKVAAMARSFLMPQVQEPEVTGELKKAADGAYYYYVNGEVDTTYTGLADNRFGTWYVENGKLNFGCNGLVTFEGASYYIRGGMVNTNLNGVKKVDGRWLYFAAGVLDESFTGMAQCNDFLVYVENGVVNFNKTGVVSWDNTLYYVRNSYATSYTGLARTDDGKWLYMDNGVWNPAYTGIAMNGQNWYYVENGAVNFKFTGTVSTDTGDWNVVHGVVDLQASQANQ